MSTLIKFKRADIASSLSAVTLAHGEPAVDFQNGVLYIGDGTNTPGLIFASTDSTASLHSIATTVNIGSSHTITATKLGQVLRSTGTDTARMQRLGFYDLGEIAAIPTSTIADSTGLTSRWHWMTTEHVGSKRSIFMTVEDRTSVGDGTGTGHGNMAHSGISGASTAIGYRVESLSYDITSLPDTTSSRMALVAYKDGTNNSLSFVQLSGSDITGSPSHDMTSASHLCTASSIFYSGNANSMKQASYLAAANNSILKKSGNTTLVWGSIGYADLTGNFTYLSSSASNDNTLRYDTSSGSWLRNRHVNSHNDSTRIGMTIDNSGVTALSPFLKIQRYSTDNSIEITCPTATDPEFSSNTYWSSQNGALINVRGYSKVLSIFTTEDPRVAGTAPNLRLTSQGSMYLKVPTTISTLGIVDSAASSSYRDFLIVGKTIAFSSDSRSTLPSWSGIEIGDINVEQGKFGISTQSNYISNIKLGNIDITYTGMTVAVDNPLPTGNTLQPARHINAGSISTFNSITGIYIDDLLINSGSTLAKTCCGLNFTSVRNDSTTSGYATGINISEISHGVGVTTAFNTTNLHGRYTYGLKLSTFSSSIESVAIDVKDVVSNVRAVGVSVRGVSTESPTATDRIAGVLVDMGTAGTEPILDAHRGISWSIYTKGGRHYLGGNLDISGTTNIDGNMDISGNISLWKDGSKLTVIGEDDHSGSITVSNGGIYIPNGIVQEGGGYLHTYILDQTSNGTDFLKTGAGVEIDTKKYRCIVLRSNYSLPDPFTIYRLKPGYPGQLLTLAVEYAGPSSANGDNTIELKCAAFNDDQVGSGRKSNLILNEHKMDSQFAPDLTISKDLQIYPNYPVLLQYIPHARSTPITWLPNTVIPNTSVSSLGLATERYGAWVVITSGKADRIL